MPQEIPADSSPASKRSRRHHRRTVDLEQPGCCGSIQGGVLQRKLPDLPDVRSPEALAAYLDARRLRYSRRTVSLGRAQAVEFEVAEVGLAVLLAPESVCRSLGAPTLYIVSECLRSCAVVLARQIAEAPLVSGVAEFLDSAGCALYVRSCAPELEDHEQIARRGLESRFSGVFCGDTPKSEAMRKIAARHQGHQVVFFGDSGGLRCSQAVRGRICRSHLRAG